jgi:outer membrane protein assembly factor BamB
MRWYRGVAVLWAIAGASVVAADGPQPLAHWPLLHDRRDISGHERHLELTGAGVDFSTLEGDAAASAKFDGRTSALTLDADSAPQWGMGEFSITAWVHVAEVLDDVPGDLISQFDPEARRGFQLSIETAAGVTSSQPNLRTLHFGIDNGRMDAEWTDHGRLGDAVLIFSMAVHEGQLFAGTCEAGVEQSGCVYRFDGESWHDCGRPNPANAISALAVYRGELYAAASRYRLRGSALTESENPHIGGTIYRYVEDGEWIDCGKLPEVEAVGGLVVYKDRLYAGSLYAPAGLFRYEGDARWTACATPEGKRVEALCVHDGHLYATGYDEGAVYRFDGETWEHLGRVGDATQTYGFAVYEGELYVSEWPNAKVYRYGGGTEWIPAGRLGEELETMPLMVYNGKLYGGTLPLGEVYRYEGEEDWTRIARLDLTPDVKYRRVWSMAIYNGRLFAGTLPSGRVYSIECGRNATYDRPLEPGWRHIAAVRERSRLKLYVDGVEVAASREFAAEEYDLTNAQPLTIGSGPTDHFNGRLRDVRLYDRALTGIEVEALSR